MRLDVEGGNFKMQRKQRKVHPLKIEKKLATGHLFSVFEGCTTSKKSDKFGIEIGIEVGMT